MKRIDIVVPCYNEEECICLLFERVEKVFSNIEGYKFRIVYVDDGSVDETLTKIKRLAEDIGEDTIKYISLSRNFGKEAAMFAGLQNADGDAVVLMDADLQHPPELIPYMLKVLEEGYDCCGARRKDRKGEPVIRSFFSTCFYRVINGLSKVDLSQNGSDYRMISPKVVRAMISLNERERFTKGIFSWVGFSTKWLEYENVERVAGTTKWSMAALLGYAVNGIIAFATAPLRGVVYLGMFITFISFIYAIYVFYNAIFHTGARSGYATITLLLLFLGGVIILLLGVIGEYLARIYIEVKQRPIYIEKETNIYAKGTNDK